MSRIGLGWQSVMDITKVPALAMEDGVHMLGIRFTSVKSVLGDRKAGDPECPSKDGVIQTPKRYMQNGKNGKPKD